MQSVNASHDNNNTHISNENSSNVSIITMNIILIKNDSMEDIMTITAMML